MEYQGEILKFYRKVIANRCYGVWLSKEPEKPILLWSSVLTHLKQRRCYFINLIFSKMSKQKEITQSPVQTENEQTYDKSVFIKNFKKLYLKQPIKTILQDFVDCHIRLAELEQLEIDREEVSNG